MTLLSACGPVALPLALLALVLLTVLVERALFWWRWWRPPHRDSRHWFLKMDSGLAPHQQRALLQRADQTMAFGETLLQAVVLLAPLLGLVGTVLGLMAVLRQLGPQLLLPANNPLVAYADVLAPTALGLELATGAMALLLLNQGLRRWQQRSLAARCLPVEPEPWGEPTP